MKINNEEIQLKITPSALRKAEELYEDYDFLKILREAEKGKEPRMSDYYKVVYTGYLGAKPDLEIKYDEFLKLIEDIDLITINNVGVKLLTTRKN